MLLVDYSLVGEFSLEYLPENFTDLLNLQAERAGRHHKSGLISQEELDGRLNQLKKARGVAKKGTELEASIKLSAPPEIQNDPKKLKEYREKLFGGKLTRKGHYPNNDVTKKFVPDADASLMNRRLVGSAGDHVNVNVSDYFTPNHQRHQKLNNQITEGLVKNKAVPPNIFRRKTLIGNPQIGRGQGGKNALLYGGAGLLAGAALLQPQD